MDVRLVPMNEETFKTYYEKAITEYAYEHVKSGSWTEEKAIQKATEQFEDLLLDGLATKEHFLFSVLDGEDPVGILWLRIRLTDQGKQAFIFDIKLEESERGKGYGKATMKALDDYAEKEGISQIRLHVFAHNERAIALYEKMGFEMTNHYMSKEYR